MPAGFVKIVAYVPPWLADHLRLLADEEGRAQSDLIERALRATYAPLNPIQITVCAPGQVALSLLCVDGSYKESMRCAEADCAAKETDLRRKWVRAGILAMRIPNHQQG